MISKRSTAASEFALAAVLLLLVSCGGKKKPESQFPPTPLKGGVQEGISSWYGKEFDGRPTASGERFDMYALTAAHRTISLGSTVSVTNLENGRSAILRVNDRGPFIQGRILDCSYGAAKELGFSGAGLARVRIEMVSEAPEKRRPGAAAGREIYSAKIPKDSVLDATFCVQAGAFGVKDNAIRFRDFLEEKLGDAYVIKFGEFYRVRVGHLGSEEEACELAAKVKQLGHEGFVTRND